MYPNFFFHYFHLQIHISLFQEFGGMSTIVAIAIIKKNEKKSAQISIIPTHNCKKWLF